MNRPLTDREVESLAESLKELLTLLRDEKAALEKRISKVAANLDLIQAEPTNKPKTEIVAVSRKSHQKRPYGKNPKQIKRFLNNHPTDSFKSDAIAYQLGIARSSTYATLKRLEKKGEAECIDGQWRKKLNKQKVTV